MLVGRHRNMTILREMAVNFAPHNGIITTVTLASAYFEINVDAFLGANLLQYPYLENSGLLQKLG